MILRLLGPQGIAGVAVAICLSLLLVLQKAETRRWRERSAEHEQLYRAEQTAFAATVANYRAAADAARAADKANAERAAAAQRAINERTAHDFEARLAAARAVAAKLSSGRLRREGESPADPSRGGGADMSGLPAPAPGIAQGAGHDRLPDPDRLIATEQAIQLDELIKWVRRQHSVDPNEAAEVQSAVDPGANRPQR